MSRRGISIKTVQRSHLEDIVCRHENKTRQKSRIYQIRQGMKRDEEAVVRASDSERKTGSIK